MKDKSTDQRIQRWTRRPDRAIPYGPLARFSDWWCASRDARAGLKDLLVPADADDSAPEPGTEAALATPRTVFLGQLGRGRAEKQWIWYQADVADSQIQLTQARARRETALQQRAAAQDRLANLAEPTPEELKSRRSGEERTSETVLADRRMRTYTERRQALDTDLVKIRATLSECDKEIARLRETIRIRFEVVRTQAEIIGAYVRRRCAAYLTRLIRKHPNGKEIGALVRTDWQGPPRWSTWDAPPDTGDPPAEPRLAATTGGE